MKTKRAVGLLAAAILAVSSAAAFAAGAKTYQVTGPVLEVTDSMIAVQKGGERWEFNRDANAKVTGELKVGEKVTITYAMSAVTIEVKAPKAEKTDKTETPEKAAKKNAADGEASPTASPHE
jgi:ribosomal 50S subunit-recycling heat shock protein